MSATVDERVLEMRFNNSQFEANVKQSMSTLDRLKAALKFDKAGAGLEKIGKAAKNVKMDALASSVDSVKKSFSALDVVGVTALANIANSAVNTGKKMVKALTLDPVISGFQEYETKINAVQTILANTSKEGMTMQDVTNVLDDLNAYADKTIYNFAEMTRNIGTFTAAGVGLYDAAGAIKGIANLAAVSGSNSNQASTAMYQLSQALATGTVKLQDWNSVVNAGMGGTKFQDALKQTARDMGIAVDEIIDHYGSFRDSLTYGGWVTSDVLNQTLKNFTVEGAAEYVQAMKEMGKYTDEQADAMMREAQIAEDAATKVKTFTQLWDVMKEAAQSGWAQTWEIIIGDFEEAKQFLTPIADLMQNVIAESANARNSVLQSGLQSSWKTLSNDIRAAGIDVSDFQNKLIEVGKEHGVVTDEMIIEAGSFEESLRSGWASGDIFAEALRSYKVTAEEFGITTESMQDKLTQFQEVVKEVWDSDLVTQQERMRALAEAGYDYNEIQGLIDKTLRGQAVTLDELSVAQMKALGFTTEEIMALQDMAGEAETAGTAFNKLIEDLTKPSGRELFLEGMTNILFNLIHVMDIVKQAWRETFPPLEGSTLYSWLEAFRDLTERFSLTAEGAENLRWTLRGLFSILHMLVTIVTVPLKVGLEAIGKLLEGALKLPILDVTAAIGKAVVWFDKLIFASGRYEKLVRALPNAIYKFLDVLKMWFEEFKQLPQVQEAVGNIQEKFNSTLSFITNRLYATSDAMREFIDRIRAMDSVHLKDLPNIFKDFYKNVVNTAVDVDGVFAAIKASLVRFAETAKTIGRKIVEVFKTIGTGISNVGKKLKNIIRDDLNFSDILAVLISGGTIAAVMKFAKVMELLLTPLKGIDKVLESFAKIGNSISKNIDARTWGIRAKAVKTIASAILELAAALWVIAQIPADKVLTSLGVLGILAAGIVALTMSLKAINGPAGLEKTAGALIAFGGAIALMSLSLAAIADIQPDRLLGSIFALETIMISFGVISGILGSKVASFSKGSRFLLSFAVAIRVLVGSLKALDEIDVKSLPKTVSMLVGCIGVLAALAKIGSSVNWKGGIAMIAMIAAVRLMIGLIDNLAEIDPAEAIKAIVGIMPIFAMLRMMMNIISRTTTGPGVVKAAASLAIMSGAILLLSTSMKMIAGLSGIDAAKGIVAINSFLLSFAVILAFANNISKHILKAGASFILMGVAVGILAGVMALMSKLDPAGMARATVAITMLEAVFLAMVYVSKFASANKGTITALAVSIGILVGSMAALSLLDPAAMARATVAISAVMGMFTLLLRATAVVKKVNATIFIMVGVVAGLTALLFALASIPVEGALTNVAALTVLLTAMTASLYAMSLMKNSALKGVGALALLGLVIAELAAILVVLSELDVEPSIEVAQSLSILLAAMTGVTAAMSAIGHFAGPLVAAKGAAALSIVIGIIGGLMTGVGALVTYIPKLEEFATNGIRLLNLVASGIGEFIGNLIGGVGEGLTSHMGAIADNLSDFITRLQPFLDGAAKIDPSVTEGVSAIASTVTQLAGAGLAEAISSFLTGGSSMAEFADALIPFGEALAKFAASTEEIDAGHMDSVAKASQSLVDIANSLPDSGGLKDKIIGVKDMTSFIKDLDPLADALINFNAKVTAEGAIDTSALNKVAESTQKLADIANSLPSQGTSLKSVLVGTQDLSVFADQLTKLGESLVTFSTTVGPIDVGKLQEISGAVDALVELNAKLPNNSSVLGKFFVGEKDIAVFGEQLVVFGKAMADYTTAVSGKVDKGAIDASAAAAQALVELANNLPDPGFFSTQFQFDQFGRQLEAFGTSFANYANSISGIADMSVITESANVAQSMVTLLTSLPKNEFLTNETWLDEFGYQIVSFGNSLSKFYSNIEGIKSGKMQSVVNIADTLATMATKITEIDQSSFEKLTEFMDTLVNLEFDAAGASMEDFAGKVVSFTESIGKIQEEDVGKIEPLLEGITNIQNALMQKGPADGAQWLSDFGDQMENFGTSFKKFAKAVSNITPESIQPALDAMTQISSVATDLVGVDLTGFGAIVESLSGVTDIAGKDLENLEPNMETLGKAMSAYSKAIGEFKPQSAQSSLHVANALSDLVKNLPDPGLISTQLTLPKFSEQIGVFGKAMGQYAKDIGEFPVDATIGSANAGMALAKLAEALPDPGLVSTKLTLPQFAEQIGPFGSAMAEYATNLGEFSADAVIASANAGQALAALANNLPDASSPSMQAVTSGKMSLSQFAMELPIFASSMSQFSTNLGEFSDEKVDSALNAGRALSEFAKNLPDASTPALQATSGGKLSLAQFSNQLPGFATNMADFSTNLGGEFSEEKVTSAANAGRALAEMMNALPDTSGVAGLVMGGQMSIGQLAKDLPEFGTQMADFSTNLGDFTGDKVMAAANAGKALAELATSLSGIQSFGVGILSSFGDDLTKFAESLKGFADTIPFVNISVLQQLTGALRDLGACAGELKSQNAGYVFKSFAEGLKELAGVSIAKIAMDIAAGAGQIRQAAANLVNAFNAGISTGAQTSAQTFTTAIQGMINAANSASGQFQAAGTSMMHVFNSALESGIAKVLRTITTGMNNAVNTIRSKHGAFQAAGSYVMQGLIAGMNSKLPMLMATAERIASRLSAKINNALEVESPSKVMMRTGNFVVEGLAKGMDDNAFKANRSGATMARGLITAMQKELLINSPSIVARDEVGKYIVDGIAEGIEENMSAEDAAAKKAQNIIDAFQSEIDKYDATWNSADLEWQLFQALNEDTIGEAEMGRLKYAHQQDQMRILAEKVELARGEYDKMVETFGESSDEALDAKDKWIQSQIDLAKVAKESRETLKQINEDVEEYNKAADESYKRYVDRFAELSHLVQDMPQMGFTYEDIDRAARHDAGYTSYMHQDLVDTAGTIKSTFENALSGVAGTYTEFAKTGFGKAIVEYSKTGQKLVNATAQAVNQATPKAEQASGKMAQSGADAASAKTTEFQNAGEAVGSAFVTGIESKIPEAKAAADELVGAATSATKAIETVKKASSGKTPGGKSGKTIWNDFDTYGATLNKGIGKSGHVTIPGTSITYESVGSIVMSGRKVGFATGIGPTTQLAHQVASAIEEKENTDSRSKSMTVTNNYNMTQNNSSPKALSNSEIYRQTNTLFNKLKTTTSPAPSKVGVIVS